MNINPYSPTTPHCDSYEDFYKFFEVFPKEIKEDVSFDVFPPIEQMEKEKIIKPEQDTKKEPLSEALFRYSGAERNMIIYYWTRGLKSGM